MQKETKNTDPAEILRKKFKNNPLYIVTIPILNILKPTKIILSDILPISFSKLFILLIYIKLSESII